MTTPGSSNDVDSEQLHVAIDGRVNPASAGGVAQVIQGLVRALGQIEEPSTHYTIVIESEEERDFFEPHLGKNQRFAVKKRSASSRVRRLLKRAEQSARRLAVADNSSA